MLLLKDDNPKNIMPIVTVGIIVGCVLIFLWQASLHHHTARRAVLALGASGAIAGVLGAYLVLYPRARVLVWAFTFFVFRLPAWVVLGLWFAMQVVKSGNGESNVAWWADIGGMVACAALIPLFKYRSVGLFGRGHLSQTKPPIKR